MDQTKIWYSCLIKKRVNFSNSCLATPKSCDTMFVSGWLYIYIYIYIYIYPKCHIEILEYFSTVINQWPVSHIPFYPVYSYLSIYLSQYIYMKSQILHVYISHFSLLSLSLYICIKCILVLPIAYQSIYLSEYIYIYIYSKGINSCHLCYAKLFIWTELLVAIKRIYVNKTKSDTYAFEIPLLMLSFLVAVW